MFSRQTPTLDNALWQGGLSAAQAHVIANALGQCRQTLDHRGPVQIDYTSPDMKLIMPESAQIQFPDIQLQPPEALPPRPDRPFLPALPPEEEPPYLPDPFPPPSFPEYPGPGGDTGGGGGGCCVPDWLLDLIEWAGKQWEQLKKFILASGGAYIRVDVVAQDSSYNVNLDVEDDSQGNICTFGNDKIKGLSKEDFVQELDGELLDWLEDQIDDGGTGQSTSVVTGITLANGKLNITTASVRALEVNAGGNSDIDLIECS
jgi:hypothetical protein